MKSPAPWLFTARVTSLDRVDHAVTDEERSGRLIQNRGSFMAAEGSEVDTDTTRLVVLLC